MRGTVEGVLLESMANIFTRIFGTKNNRELARMGKIVARVNACEGNFDADFEDLYAGRPARCTKSVPFGS